MLFIIHFVLSMFFEGDGRVEGWRERERESSCKDSIGQVSV